MELLQKLDPPLGMGQNPPRRLVYKRLIDMDVPLDEKGKADFTQVLIGMMKKARIKKQIFGVKNYKFFQIFNEMFRLLEDLILIIIWSPNSYKSWMLYS